MLASPEIDEPAAKVLGSYFFLLMHFKENKYKVDNPKLQTRDNLSLSLSKLIPSGPKILEW